ncbi:MAG: hypothetical protein S4CHLAM2_15610 [Chlamydiales bacterium]|nr:hypothetical protein [Chlamydiales bacterium]
MKFSASEKLLVEDICQTARDLQKSVRGLSIGELIRLVRTQLGMSQNRLASRAGVPQSTISRVEKGVRDVGLSTLQKILGALSCDLVVAPVLQGTIESIHHKQARARAQKQVDYLTGTMNLEQQRPDEKFKNELIKQEEQRLLQGPKSKLWEE